MPQLGRRTNSDHRLDTNVRARMWAMAAPPKRLAITRPFILTRGPAVPGSAPRI